MLKTKKMVATRGLKYKFCIGEKVLCYEPDITKAKVLYDSKVMAVFDEKDKRGKKIVEYLIHFQGWNSSWDRRVNEDFVLKDIDENRQLQKDLADQAQLQIGAYLYRKERKKRSRQMSGSSSDTKIRFRGSSEDGSSCSTAGGGVGVGGRGEDCDEHSIAEAHDVDTESYSSSVESAANEDDRVYLQIGDQLKGFLEFDYNMIAKHDKLINLPAKMPVVTILENFVKHFSIKAISCPNEVETPRRRNSSAKVEKREKDYEKLNNSINLRKEVADGLRLYFDFTLKDYLLYKQEKEQANHLLSEENLKNFTYIASERQSLEMFYSTVKSDSQSTPAGSEQNESSPQLLDTQPSQSSNENENVSKRRLRSYKTEESEFIFDIGLTPSLKADNFSSVASTSSGGSTPAATNIDILKNLLPLNITTKTKEILQSILSWQILPSDAPPEPSMIYGAVHLGRLIVKLPDFLNASTLSDDKLKMLLKYLDVFIEYLESHKEWFSDLNYKDAVVVTSPKETADNKENVTKTTITDDPPSLSTDNLAT